MNDNFFGKLFGGNSDDGSDKGEKPRSPTPAPAQPQAPRPAGPPAGNAGAPPRPAAPSAPTPPSQPAAPRPVAPTGVPSGAPQPRPAAPTGAPTATSQPPAAAPRPTGIPSSASRTSSGQARAGANNEEEGEYSIDDLLKLIVEKSGSDLHLTVGAPPMLRLQGKLWPTELAILTAKETRRLIFQFLSNEHRERLERDLELDISYELEGVARYRCNVFFTRMGLGAVFRVIPTNIKSLGELKLPAVLGDLARRNKGLILVTGPTGSGKSTTLAAMVDQINSERQDHILTIEDPIEFVHRHRTCLVNQREIGPNTRSFSNALRSALREDPDIILVGEMRDYETISLAVTAAETGHLVFATLHTPSAAQSVDRIVDVFPAHQQDQIRTQLADALQGIVAQQLIPTIDGMSRACCLEILINTPAVSNLIRENKTFQLPSIMQTSKQMGMQTMDQSLMDLVKQRKISPQEAYRRAFDKKAFEQYKPRDY
ncbi:MAG: PilT/PilU family type 4a pilus ATPase [Candidatus Rifleibacteriota bacterium]